MKQKRFKLNIVESHTINLYFMKFCSLFFLFFWINRSSSNSITNAAYLLTISHIRDFVKCIYVFENEFY